MKPRENMQVSPQFRKKMIEIQAKFLLKGIRKTLTEITGDIIKMGCIDNIDSDMEDIIIKIDKRRRFF